MRVPVERDLAVVHGLEQRALGTRGRAVDLVSQHHIGEERARRKTNWPEAMSSTETPRMSEGRRSLVKLDAMKGSAHGEGQGTSQGRLAHTGHVLDEEMATRQQGQHRIADGRRFAPDDLGDVSLKPLHQFGRGALTFGRHKSIHRRNDTSAGGTSLMAQGLALRSVVERNDRHILPTCQPDNECP